MSRRKNIILAASASALALSLGLGAAAMASATTTPTPGTVTGTHDVKDGHGKPGGQMAATLAAKLGVDEAKVTEALKALRDANKADHLAKEAAVAKSLAASLGIDEAKVTAAIDELRSTHKATDRAAAMKTRLDKAVAAGKLTQAEAEAVTKAVESGVLGGRKH
ncbi:hypothetical protein ACS5PJ_19845 [Pseudarthrobacter sp. YS3]|uniref:hypothetical protein n=1 Tax=Pseudarthrobacter sp. YS3 TaxID=3453718 RepID=UPI003EEBEFE8